jgi:Family of unknown function (DUF5336)
MTYHYGGPDQYPPQASAAYGTHWPQPTSAAAQRTPPVKPLAWVVLLLGLATYVVSYAAVPQPGGIGWAVRFSALAAVVAALGLLPRQALHAKSMVALAVMGFLEALWWSISGIDGQHGGWAAVVIVILNALQAVTALAALLAQLRDIGAADRGSTPYDAYAYYAQAAQQYYAANAQQPQHQPVQAQATASAASAAPAQAQQSTAERDALYAEYLSAPQPGANRRAPSPHSGGRRQTAQPVPGTGVPATGWADSVRPGDDAATGSPNQSSP